MTNHSTQSTTKLWAHFRFSVIGALLAAPAPRGELKAAIRSLADKVWTHPITGKEVQFAANTIERWYYKARHEQQDPVGVLQRAVRSDAGKVSVGTKLAEYLRQQYRHHADWSYQLHYDNLASAVKADASLGPLRSYSTIKRFMQASGMRRKRRPAKGRGATPFTHRRENREIRSYESEYVGSLWHLDFHHGSLKRLLLSSEHRAAAAPPPVYLELVTSAQTAHLAVIAETRDEDRSTLQDRVLELLAAGHVLTRAKLRENLAVKNERLGEVLESLERAGRIGRQANGWQLLP